MTEPNGHQWNWATMCCERCGATPLAVDRGERPKTCEAGVIGISHRVRATRLGELFGPTKAVPFFGKIGGGRFDGERVRNDVPAGDPFTIKPFTITLPGYGPDAA